MGVYFKPQLRLFARFSRYIVPYRKKWCAIFMLSTAGALLGLVSPYLVKLIIDRAIDHKDLYGFILYASIATAVYVISAVAQGRSDFLNSYIKLKVNFDLSKALFEHMQGFPIRWFQNKSTGEHVYKFEYDAEEIAHFVTTAAPQAAYLFPRLALTVFIVCYLHWRMAVLSFLLAPLVCLPPYYFTRIMRATYKNVVEQSERIVNFLQESFSHIHVIKVFGREAAAIKAYVQKLLGKVEIETRRARLDALNSFAATMMSKMIMGVLVFYGGYQVIKGELTLGSLTAIMVYLTQLVFLQKQCAQFFQTVALGFVSCQRVASILDEKLYGAEIKSGKKVPFTRSDIEFENVSFGYAYGEYLLKDINFRIKTGRTVALAGSSGCGKTTLLYLLARLYEPYSGNIIIGGHNIKNLELNSIKEQIGFAMQEPFLWNDTIENNIRYSQEGAGRSEVIAAATLAGAEGFINNLANGYDTIIGENACKLSEGQKQRIAIARALIKKPKILILDEAMSSLDSESEEKILGNIKSSQPELTVIIVSHRLSTVMQADLVYFFTKPDAMVITKGLNLLKENKGFSDLFAEQSRAIL